MLRYTKYNRLRYIKTSGNSECYLGTLHLQKLDTKLLGLQCTLNKVVKKFQFFHDKVRLHVTVAMINTILLLGWEFFFYPIKSINKTLLHIPPMHPY